MFPLSVNRHNDIINIWHNLSVVYTWTRTLKGFYCYRPKVTKVFQIFIPYTWHEICQNTGFLWSVFSRTRAESTTYDNKVRIILQDQKQLAWKIRCSPLSEMRQITSSFMLVLIISTPTKQPKVLQIPWPTLQCSWKMTNMHIKYHI